MLLSANGRYGIAAIDVSTASAPIQRSSLNNGFGAGSVVVAGNTAFVGFGGNYSSGGPSISIPVLTAIDVSNKLAPIRGATMNSNSTLQTLVQVNTGLFGPTQNYGTRSINIQNPLAPAAGSTRSTDIAGYCGARLGQNLIIGGDNDQSPASPLLRVLDGSNVNNNTPLGTLQVSTENGGIWSVATFGTTVFAIHANSQLRIYDYSNVSSPSLLGSVPYIVHPSGMAISDNGNFIYVSDYSNGLTVFDCTNRAAPVLVATYARNGVTSGYSVAVRGNLLAYGDSREISILDCTDPRVPTLVGAYDTPGIPYGLQFVGDDVFVADGNAGFSILRLGDINKPVIQITTPTTNTAFPTTSALLTLGGTATDLQGVVRVTWENDRGGGGVAQGTTAWSIPGIQLAAGVNVLTVTAADAQGTLARDSITVTATLPDGTKRTLIDVPRWNYNWQDEYYYERPFALPKGTRIDLLAAFDNSAANPSNPSNPPKRVTWGEGTLDEMLYCFFLITAEKAEDVIHTIFHSMAHDAKQPRDEAARRAGEPAK